MKRPATQNNFPSNRTQFDYPNTKTVQGYKNYIPSVQNPHIQTAQKKQRYKKFIKEQQEKDRDKAKTNIMMQRQKQRLQKQKQLLQQLEAKKNQLQELQRIRKQAIQQEKRAQQLAILKVQKDEIRKIEDQQRTKENKHTANFRFIEALKRLEQDNKERDFKKSQAHLRRKVIQQTQKVQREKAIQYSSWIEQKKRNQKLNSKPEFDQFKQPLGTSGFVQAIGTTDKNKSKDYTKSYSHNPKLIVAYKILESQENSAMEQASIISQRNRQSSFEKERDSAQKRKKSLQRGRQAMLKIEFQKQYKEYCKNAQQKSFEYNMQRIQSAKQNQFIGMKPATLQQMQTNKKMRTDQQFTNMFLANSNNPQWQIANKHEMRRWRQNNINQSNHSSDSEKQIIIKKYNIPLNRMDQEKFVIRQSEIKYSFEDNIVDNIENLTSVKKYQQNSRIQSPSGTEQQNEFPRRMREQKKINSRVIVYDHKDLGQTVSGTKQINLNNINTDLGDDSLQQIRKSPEYKNSRLFNKQSSEKRRIIQKYSSKKNKNQRFDQLEYSQSEQEQDSSYMQR